MITSYAPQDLRTEDPRRTASIEDARSTVAAGVRRRLGDDCDDVLNMLGLAVTS
ncbi:hypothetical protein [Curtobacterium sp. MCBD17_021]|uniref:hypothetical protein n=1 Tax=Curtobacterium sp. MCBD17_021 TaxID=2175665 RepID=UPI0015E8D806|nr:hypothetical protein [Curtobacterium sp. MCBD17_021]